MGKKKKGGGSSEQSATAASDEKQDNLLAAVKPEQPLSPTAGVTNAASLSTAATSKSAELVASLKAAKPVDTPGEEEQQASSASASTGSKRKKKKGGGGGAGGAGGVAGAAEADQAEALLLEKRAEVAAALLGNGQSDGQSKQAVDAATGEGPASAGSGSKRKKKKAKGQSAAAEVRPAENPQEDLTDRVEITLPKPAKAAARTTPGAIDGDWEDLKKVGTERYMADDFEGAITMYGSSISAFEALNGDEPDDSEARKALAILYTNRAMASLQLVRRAKKGQQLQNGTPLPAELRKLAMRANVDASNAVELDESNGKAWLRKGQALLLMSSMQQRAKEAMMALEQASKSPNLPASMTQEVAQWRKYATGEFNNQTPMPANCPQM